MVDRSLRSRYTAYWVQPAHFKRTLQRARLPDTYRFHALCHTSATTLAANGLHPHVAMEVLEPQQISTTLEIYRHVAPQNNNLP